MSMHKIPLTKLEEDGLRAHKLDIGVPSQLSDVFRQGIAWANSQSNKEMQFCVAELIRSGTEHEALVIHLIDTIRLLEKEIINLTNEANPLLPKLTGITEALSACYMKGDTALERYRMKYCLELAETARKDRWFGDQCVRNLQKIAYGSYHAS